MPLPQLGTPGVGGGRYVECVLTTLAIENYRSLRRLVLPLRRLNVVTGANGTGKSSLYRALRLLAEASRNGAVAALAREGGLPSTLWGIYPFGGVVSTPMKLPWLRPCLMAAYLRIRRSTRVLDPRG